MNKTGRTPNLTTKALDALIDDITVDAYGDDEQLWAFLQSFTDNIDLPCEGFLLGEPVTVVKFDYDGNLRRGLTAKCRRKDGASHVISAVDLQMPAGSEGARYHAAYRKWMGLSPLPPAAVTPERRSKAHAATPAVDLNGPVELVVLSVSQKAARCRIAGSGTVITLRATRLWEAIPGEVVVVRPNKQWTYSGHSYLSGKIESTRLDTTALGLVPLAIHEAGLWDPRGKDWRDQVGPLAKWAKAIIARGPRPQFEMEQVLPGFDFSDPFTDPIGQANDRKEVGDLEGATRILMDCCEADLRCLDAHAHLGNLAFDRLPKEAIRHYEVGLRIGEMSLGPGFDGVLPWGMINNRPFLRCLNGYGLCLWRLGRFQDAAQIFDRILWLNPADNLGVRFLIDDVQRKIAWEIACGA